MRPIISTKLLWNGQSFDQEEHILPVTFSTIDYTVATTYNEGTSGSGTGTTGYYSYIAQQTETGFRLSVYGASGGQSSSYYCCGY